MFLPARPNWGRCRLFTLAVTNMNILLWYLPYAMFSGAWDVALSESDMRTDKEGWPNESRTATNLNNKGPRNFVPTLPSHNERKTEMKPCMDWWL